MDEKKSLSINEIFQAISTLDPQARYNKVSYNLSTRNILCPDAWWVFIPFGQWGNPLSLPNPSPLETAVLQAIPSGTRNECFIDILNLQVGHASFFYDPSATRKIVDALSYFINSLPTNVKPIIRYLLGYGTIDYKSPQQDGFVQALYTHGNFKNKNALLYFGNFAPTLPYPEDKDLETIPSAEIEITGIWKLIEEEIEKFWNWLIAKIKEYSEVLWQEIEKIAGEIKSWIQQHIRLTTRPLSWNHAKIFAVNGQSLVTGGANYWDKYATNSKDIFDLSMSITGDAAIDAHRFADYFWNYLKVIPFWDNKSWCQSNLLASPKGMAGFTDTRVIQDWGNSSSANTGNIPALSVGKSGNWPLPVLGISAQIFDSARDFILNIIAAIAEAEKKPVLLAFVTKLVSDDNSDFRSMLEDMKIYPAAWASRYAKNYAVSQAQQSVKFSQQTFANTIGDEDTSYQAQVTKINNYLSKELNTNVNWDGHIWPYDLLRALGQALSNISNNTTDDAPFMIMPRVEIVTSCPSGGYQDKITAAEFKNKLTELMEGLALIGDIRLKGTIQDVIKNLLEFKRISNSSVYGNHAKLVLVDDSVCYIGSDNAYPSYNEEFGLWIDDQPSIQSFITDYWAGLSAFAQQAT